MGKFPDLTGRVFGRLTVLSKLDYTIRGCISYRCRCSCPKQTIVNVEGSRLIRGAVKSCGCLHDEITHSRIYAKEDERLVDKLHSMKQRCYNPKCNLYKYYGGRGIKVCDLWLKDTHAFIKWSHEHGYVRGLELDRIDVNGDYCPENCRYVTHTENQNNRRCNRSLSIDGETKTLAQWDAFIGERSGFMADALRDNSVEVMSNYIRTRFERAPVLRRKRELEQFMKDNGFTSLFPCISEREKRYGKINDKLRGLGHARKERCDPWSRSERTYVWPFNGD